MNFTKDNILFWYRSNLGKVVFLLAVIVALTLTVVYIPYLNIIIPSSMGFLIAFLVWYILFSPSNVVLIFFSIILLTVAMITTLIDLNSLTESFGIIIYLLLILVFINNVKNFLAKNKKTSTTK